MKEVTVFFGSLSLLLNIIMLILAIIQEVSTVKQKKKTFSLLLLVFLFASNALSIGAVGTWLWGASAHLHTPLSCLAVSYIYWLTTGINRFILMIIAIDRFLAVMNPFRYKQYMNSGKVLTLTVVYCLSIVVMPSVATEHYSNSYSYERQLNFCVPESGSNGLFHGWYVCDLVFPVAIIVILYTYMITFLGSKIHNGAKQSNSSRRQSIAPQNTPQPVNPKRHRRRGRRFRKISVANMDLQTCRTSSSSADALMWSSSIKRQGVPSSIIDPTPSPEQVNPVLPGSASIVPSSNNDLFELHHAPSISLRPPDTPNSLPLPKPKLSKSDSSLDNTDSTGFPLRDTAFSIVKRHSKSDYDIRRCSSIISGKMKGPGFKLKRLSVNGVIFNRFRSIYTIIMCCLSEILLVASLDILLYVLTVTNMMPADIKFHTVHVLILHLLATPLLYSYGFAPLKKRIKRALHLHTPNQGPEDAAGHQQSQSIF